MPSYVIIYRTYKLLKLSGFLVHHVYKHGNSNYIFSCLDNVMLRRHCYVHNINRLRHFNNANANISYLTACFLVEAKTPAIIISKIPVCHALLLNDVRRCCWRFFYLRQRGYVILGFVCTACLFVC